MKSIEIRDEAHWHEIRAQHIGGSEAAALLGVGKYDSYFSVWHRKKGNIEAENLDDVIRVKAGKFLEPAIADLFADIHGLRIRKVRRYTAHPTVRGLGATLDYEVATSSLPPAILAQCDQAANDNGVKLPGYLPFEIKNVDYLIWRDDWEHDEEINAHEPPLQIDVQVQCQMACTKTPVGLIGVLVAGNDPHLVVRPRVQPIIDLLEERAPEFWRSIDANEEPHPDYGKDLETMLQVRLGRDGEEDWTRNDAPEAVGRAEELMTEYAKGLAIANQGDAIKRKARAEFLDLIGPLQRVRISGGSCSAKTSPEKTVPEKVTPAKVVAAKRSLTLYPSVLTKQAAAAELGIEVVDEGEE